MDHDRGPQLGDGLDGLGGRNVHLHQPDAVGQVLPAAREVVQDHGLFPFSEERVHHVAPDAPRAARYEDQASRLLTRPTPPPVSAGQTVAPSDGRGRHAARYPVGAARLTPAPAPDHSA